MRDQEYYKIIWDEAELKKFYDTILTRKALLPNEVRFISLSCRNKYLDMAERKIYGLSRTEMFGKQVVRHETWEAYLQAVRRYECNVQGYLTKNGLPYPQKALVCYANINPSDVLKTIGEMNKAIDESKDALVFAAIKGSKAGVDDAFHKIRKVEDKLLSLYARNIGTKTWVDFDFDIDKSLVPAVVDIMDAFFLAKGNPEHHWVDTKGGAHMLFFKENIRYDPACICAMGAVALEIAMRLAKGNVPQHIDLDAAHAVFDSVEIIKNSNEMIPIPGTLQGLFPVKFITSSEQQYGISDNLIKEMVQAFGVKWPVLKEKKPLEEFDEE